MKSFLFFLLLFLVTHCQAQKHDYIWITGQLPSPIMALDFNYPSDSIYTINSYMPFRFSNASICDTAGHLLFYTNGISIADSSHQMMLNGDSLNPGTIAQNWVSAGYPILESSMFLPSPNTDSLFLLFHIAGNDAITIYNRLYYTTINMNLNNGKGAVIAKNQLLVQDTLDAGVEAIKHANGEDWWILIPEAYNNAFYRFLVTKDSIAGPFHQQIGTSLHGIHFSQAAFSPDGTKYARYDAENDLDIYDFDRCTGLLGNPQNIPIQDTADYYVGQSFQFPLAGLAFSPNSQYVYVNSAGIYIYQFDILAPDIAASMDTIGIYDGYYQIAPSNPSAFFLAQLAPNGKIYFNSTGTVDVWHIIHSPDSAGAACNFEQRGLQFPERMSPSIPNFPHYRMPALASPCDTLVHNTVLAPEQQQALRIFPNPAVNEIIIEWALNNTDSQKTRTIIVANALGQVIYQGSSHQFQKTINTSNWATGLYHCQLLEDGKTIHHKKIIIIHP